MNQDLKADQAKRELFKESGFYIRSVFSVVLRTCQECSSVCNVGVTDHQSSATLVCPNASDFLKFNSFKRCNILKNKLRVLICRPALLKEKIFGKLQ